MMPLGLVTPLDKHSTGVAEYSLDLLPQLARATGETVHVFGSRGVALSAGDGWELHTLDDLPNLWSQLDLLIYQMGNSPAHDFMRDTIHSYAGLVVLHDLSLHNFFARGEATRYRRACGFAYDREGSALARRYLRQAMPVDYPQYLISEWLAARHPAVIVHSRHAADTLRERCRSATIHVVPMLMPLPEYLAPQVCRAQLGVAPETFLILVFGALNRSKSPDVILDVIQRLHAEGIAAHAVFVGRETYGYQLQPEVVQRNLVAHVTQLGFVEAIEAQRWMFAADVAVGLRRMYFGETSASALRVLATGTPMIVTRIGAFDELPDAACIKLDPQDADVVEALVDALQSLYIDPQRRQSMGAVAREYVAHMHDPARIAARYVDVVNSVLDGVC